jgi:hypothetical protein
MSQIYNVLLEDVIFNGVSGGGPLDSSGDNRFYTWRRVVNRHPGVSLPGGMCQFAGQVGVLVDDCQFSGGGSANNILNLAEGVSQVTIRNSVFQGPSSIAFADCHDVRFFNNIVRLSPAEVAFQSNAGGGQSAGVHLIDNDMTFAGTANTSLVVDGPDYALMGNTITSSAGTAVYAVAISGSPAASYGRVIGNTINCTNANCKAAIDFTPDEHESVIVGNTLIGNVGSFAAMIIEDNGAQTTPGPIVAYNTIRGFTGYGIYVAGLANEVNLQLGPNSITDAAFPIGPEPLLFPILKRSRFSSAKGVTITAANDLTLGEDGNLFHVSGATQINAITTSRWQAGSEIKLIFDSNPTVKHNTAGSAGTAKLMLKAAGDLSAAANATLILTYDGTSWYEF